VYPVKLEKPLFALEVESSGNWKHSQKMREFQIPHFIPLKESNVKK